jgi:peroxiredoxin
MIAPLLLEFGRLKSSGSNMPSGHHRAARNVNTQRRVLDMKWAWIVGGVCWMTGLASAAHVPAETGTKLGTKVEPFTCPDYHGKSHSLADYADRSIVVLVFLGTECPLVKAYAPQLQTLAKEYGDRGVAFVGINSNRQDSLEEIKAYARLFGIDFPILKDNENRVADALGAIRTPEVVVLDRERMVRYHGRIDDRLGVGYARSKATSEDLRQAIEDLLAGHEVKNPRTPAPGCFIGRTSNVSPSGTITYSKHVARILQDRCERCHRSGEIGPFALGSYQDAVDWSQMIEEVVDNGRMPPWFASPKHDGEFRDQATLSPEEKQTIREWIAHGCPEGDPKDLPAARDYVDGWQIKTDQVWYMSDKPFAVKAEGTMPYEHFIVDLGLTEDRWVKGVECRPGARSVVHHVLVFIQEPGMIYAGFPGDLIAAYAPGFPPVSVPERMAVRMKKGSKVIFQLHYTPDGTAREDRSCFGVQYADANEVDYRVYVSHAMNFSFTIPPNTDNVSISATRKINKDCLLLGMNPHMHMRGKAYTYEAIYPDGRKELLLDVPRFDFNWQVPCMYHQPKPLPKGTKIVGTGVFDNSAANLNNPDPSKPVRFGEQTWEEMQIGWFTVAEKLPSRETAQAK